MVYAGLQGMSEQFNKGEETVRLRNRKTFETVIVADKDDSHFLTTDDRLLDRSIDSDWYIVNASWQRTYPTFYRPPRPNVHMNGCQAAPIPRLY